MSIPLTALTIRKNKFHGANYSKEELVTLLELTRTDVIYPAIILAGGMGLRRSEALGIRWSRIDWEKKTVLLDIKIVEYKENGKIIVRPEEEMKNKSSRRTLPLPNPVYEMLTEEKEKRTCTAGSLREATAGGMTTSSASMNWGS